VKVEREQAPAGEGDGKSGAQSEVKAETKPETKAETKAEPDTHAPKAPAEPDHADQARAKRD
jgi:hypothetical protein